MLASWEDGREGPVGDVPLREGLFETLHAVRGTLRLVERHLARMASGAPRLGLAWPPRHDPGRGLAAVLRALGAREARVRLTLGRDAAGAEHLRVEARAYRPPPEPLVLQLGAVGSAPTPTGAPALKRTEREPWDAACAAARAAGAHDVILRDRDGRLVEGGTCNLHLVLGERLVTPPLTTGALPGILRAVIAHVLAGGPVGVARPARLEEASLSTEDLERADEVLVSSALLGVRGVARVVGGARALGFPGPRGRMSALLKPLVEDCVRRES